MKKAVSLVGFQVLIGAGLGLLVLAFISLNNLETWEDFWGNQAGLFGAVLIGALCLPTVEYIQQKRRHQFPERRKQFSFFVENTLLTFLICFLIVLPIFLAIVSQSSRFILEEKEAFSLVKVFSDWYNNRGTTALLSIAFLALVYHLSYFGFYSFTLYQKSLGEAERLKRQQLESQFAVLKSQISPHFLFNSLNVLSSIVYKSAEESEKFIRELERIFKYVLENSERDLIPLEEEVRFIEAYLYLLKVRFGAGLEFSIQCSNSLSPAFLPPLTLQILVENAIKHNEASLDNPLQIDISRKASTLMVQNNRQKRAYREESLGIGLKNLHGRLFFLTERPLQVEENTQHFRVQVPLIKALFS